MELPHRTRQANLMISFRWTLRPDEIYDPEPMSSPEDDLSDTEEDTLKKDLCKWCCRSEVNQLMDRLVKIMKKHGITNVLITARTLLQTTIHYEAIEKSDMQYLSGFSQYP